MPAHRQVALHRAILGTLVQADVADDWLARFAHHAEGARDAAAVLAYAPAAARYASQLGAHREAAAQYARALRWAGQLDARQRAVLLRERSAECYLIDQVPDAIDAGRAAIAIWHELGDRQNEGYDLCLLSRSYWLAGNNAEYERAIERALKLLEHERPGLPLAVACWNYSEMRFRSCDYENAIPAAQRAMTIAGASTEPNAPYVMLHAGLIRDASRWAIEDDDGRLQLEATLQACVSRGLHEHAARAFALLDGAYSGRYLLQSAQKNVEQGLAYLQEHDIDRWQHKLLTSRCSLLLRRGFWTEALEWASRIEASPEYATVNRIIALTVIGLVLRRRGEPAAWQPLDTALELADRIGEPQRVVPVRTARAELAWLSHDLARAADEARPAFELAIQNPFRWYAVEPAVWLKRAGQLPPVHPDLPAPFGRQISGDWSGAADVWRETGCPYEQACALYDGDDVSSLRVALTLAKKLGALPLAAMLVGRLHEHGTRPASSPAHAGSTGDWNRTVAQWGLSRRELQVAGLVAQAYTNREIAERLVMSERTAEKHVQNILNRLGLRSRTQAAAWAVQHGVVTARAES
jgi:DNA-binding CsgD family transcriptional regulator/tetratricopeptide (TPR) repeat protein